MHKSQRIEIAEKVAELLASVNGRRAHHWIGGDVIRVYATAREGCGLGYLTVDSDGDVIADGWTGGSSTASVCKRNAAKIVAELEAHETALGVGVYTGA